MNFTIDKNYLDQHFLVDKDVINQVLEVSNLAKSDEVLIIGPGKGNITSRIASKVKKVYCIELDERLKPFLSKLQKEHENVEIIYGDVLKTDIPKCNKIMTSLPFSILEPFIYKFKEVDFDEIIMIIGSRYANSVLNNEISNLSLLTNCYFKCEKIMDINPSAFYPEPKVLTSLIKIRHKNPDGIYLFFKNMYELNHKKIKNCLLESLIRSNIVLTRREAKEIINDMNLKEEILETKFEICKNSQIKVLYKKIESRVYKK